MMNGCYYIKKKNGRYEKVKPFNGFPADGVWIIKGAGTSNSLLLRLPDQPIEDINEYAIKTNLFAIIQNLIEQELSVDENRLKGAWIIAKDIIEKLDDKLSQNIEDGNELEGTW